MDKLLFEILLFSNFALAFMLAGVLTAVVKRGKIRS